MNESVPSNKPLVLYVEDDESNVEVARLRLEDSVHLVVAHTDQEACDVLRAHGPRLSAILMDVELQGSELDGLKLTRLLRGLLRPESVPAWARGLPLVRAPIFVLTAYGAQYPVPMVIEAGAEDCFGKPVDFPKLTAALSKASARAVFQGLSGRGGGP